MAFGMELLDSNTICIVGGISSIEDKNLNFSSTSLLNDFWCFNVESKTFKQQSNLYLTSSRASFGLVKHENELLLIGGIEMNGEDGSKKVPITTSNVLACKLDKIDKLDKLEKLESGAINSSDWYLHSKLNQQRIFPLVGKCMKTVLVAGGKTQNHFYLKKVSLTNYCSTYEVLNDNETIKWVESPIMFATFGSCLISLI